MPLPAMRNCEWSRGRTRCNAADDQGAPDRSKALLQPTSAYPVDCAPRTAQRRCAAVGSFAPRLDIDSMIKPPFRSWADVRNAWKTLAGYERFEVVVALLLRGVIGIIIVVALYRLIAGVVDTILLRALHPLDHVVFQQVFGAIMTLLIALESITRCGTWRRAREGSSR